MRSTKNLPSSLHSAGVVHQRVRRGRLPPVVGWIFFSMILNMLFLVCPSFPQDLTTLTIGYDTTDEWGVPFGTIGAGSFCYNTYGFTQSLIYNNWDAMLGTSYTLPGHPDGSDRFAQNGTFAAVYWDSNVGSGTRLLQTHLPSESGATDYPGMIPMEGMTCRSLPPQGEFSYTSPSIPFPLELHVFSPMIPHDYQVSSYPVAVFTFKVQNPTDAPLDISFFFSVENDIGWRETSPIDYPPPADPMWERDGTYNAYFSEAGGYQGIAFDHDPLEDAGKYLQDHLGRMALATPSTPSSSVTYYSNWNTLGDGDEIWQSFSQDGTLANVDNNDVRATEGVAIYGGALAVKMTLAPGETAEIPYAFSWYFPTFHTTSPHDPDEHTHYYTQFHQDPIDFAGEALDQRQAWLSRIRDWQSPFIDSGIPPYLIEYWFATFGSFMSNSIWTDDPYFYLLEGPIFEIRGTMDVGIYASWPCLLFWPDLELLEMKTHAAFQLESGQILHGLFLDDDDYTEEPGYIIRAYRDYCWIGGEPFLVEIWPSIVKAIDYITAYKCGNDELIHTNGYVIPAGGGRTIADQSYDTWELVGATSYINSFWLAALKSASVMADRMGDSQRSDALLERYHRAAENMVNTLWHTTQSPSDDIYGYFRLFEVTDDPQDSDLLSIPRDGDACMSEQLLGALMAGQSRMNILPEGYVRQAWDNIYRVNYFEDIEDDHRGWVNGAFPFGIPDTESLQSWPDVGHSADVWTAAQWTLADGLMREGRITESLDVAQTTYDMERPFLYALWEWDGRLIAPGDWERTPWLHQPMYFGYPRIGAAWRYLASLLGMQATQDLLYIDPKAPFSTGAGMVGWRGRILDLNVSGTGSIDEVRVNGMTVPHSPDMGVTLNPADYAAGERITVDILRVEGGMEPDPAEVTGFMIANCFPEGDENPGNLFRIDSSGVTQILDTPLFEENVDISPDGNWVAFTEGDANNDFQSYDLFVVDVFGDNLTQVTDNDYMEGHPSWSPDGERIAYCAYNPVQGHTNADLFVINRDGTGKVNLTEGLYDEEFECDADWSPDGRAIAFHRGTWTWPDSEPWVYASQIYVGVLNETWDAFVDIFKVTRNGDFDGEFDPAWSPDSTRLAYCTYRGPGRFDWQGSTEEYSEYWSVYTVDVDFENRIGVNETLITPFETGKAYLTPVWSPDGTRLATVVHGEPDQESNPEFPGFELFNLDGTGRQKILYTDGNCRWYDWYDACSDLDGDGYGDPENLLCPYAEPDCQDGDPQVNPGAIEVCDNGIDDDCDTLVDSEQPGCRTIRVPSDSPTIQAGIDDSVDGDVVMVGPGTYLENINLLGKAITLRSESGTDVTIIDGGQAGSVVTCDSGETEETIIDGFTIRNGNASDGGGLYIASSSPVIVHCTISTNSASSRGGGIACHMASPSIENCRISENNAFRGGGISCDADSAPATVNCVISGNAAEASGGGIGCSASSPTITNCTITENSTDGPGAGGGISVSQESVVSVTNCILWNDSTPGEQGKEIFLTGITPNDSTLTVSYSDVQGGEGAAKVEYDSTLIWGLGNIDADPLFEGGVDYHLVEGSPCVDAGTPDPAYGEVCFPPSLGTENNDMGAYGGPGACGWLCRDEDRDGYYDETCGGRDCDDSDPTANPGHLEICDGIDNNCDAGIDEEPAASASCNNGLFCNGEEYCFQGSCRDGTEPCTDDDLFCNGEECNEDLDQCLSTGNPCPADDGLFCNGDETAECFEESDSCGHTGDPCPADGLFCNGIESCDENQDQCVTGGDPCSDENPCTGDICEEEMDECDNPCIATDPLDPCCTDPLCAEDPNCECWDIDGDGYSDEACGGEDCDDSAPGIYPGALDPCGGPDQDCDGADGVPEICDNGVDDDCDSLIDGLDPDCICYTYHVPEDYLTIQDCINSADDCDVCLVAPGTYIENIDFLGKAITLRSEEGATNTIIDGHQADSVVIFSSHEGEDSVIDGFSIVNGYAEYDENGGGIYCNGSAPTIINCTITGNGTDDDGGGIHCIGASPTITNCTISANSTDDSGGGIYCAAASSPTLSNCTISANSSDYNGGGIYCADASSLTINESTISENIAAHGSGIYCTEASLTMTDSVLSGNITSGENGSGGGIFSGEQAELTITTCTISENSASFGGGIICINTSFPTIEESTISGNSATQGGGIFCTASSPTIDHCTITGNSADLGCGLYFVSSSPTITSCAISENSAAGISDSKGGGAYFYDSTATVEESTITGNSADLGGGVHCVSSSLSITNCTLSGNDASFGGGIIYVNAFSSMITNSAIAGNSASYGGGICCSSSSLAIENCTFTGNDAFLGGGVYSSYESSPTIENSILWEDSALEDPEIFLSSGSLVVTYSDVQGGWPGDGNIDDDPLFVDPGYWDDGGTPDDLEDDYWVEGDYTLDEGPPSESPCIDAGNIDSIDDDLCFPPSAGTERNDMGAYGGPKACCWDRDKDGDGHDDIACDGIDCDDQDPEVNPDHPEVPDNGIDDNCDGEIDEGCFVGFAMEARGRKDSLRRNVAGSVDYSWKTTKGAQKNGVQPLRGAVPSRSPL